MKDGKSLFIAIILVIITLAAPAQQKKTDREMFKEGYVMQRPPVTPRESHPPNGPRT